MSKRKTTEEFIQEAKLIHGNIYDYSNVEYVNWKTKVCIICPEHGKFNQIALGHLQGQGCPKCGGTKKLTTNEFIKKAILKYENKYDYSKVNYINNKTKVCIICPIHGEFWQTPNNHLTGYGCDKCGNSYNYTTEEFIEKAKKVQGDKYNYSKVKYEDIKKKIYIICPEHGKFLQTPDKHLRGQGCPFCNKSKLENRVSSLLENINYIYQYKPLWLKNGKGQKSIDFYLPDYNIAIECQGKQHFEPINWFGGIETLKGIQERDKLKKELCKKNNLPLYYINYNDNVEEKMNKILNNK